MSLNIYKKASNGLEYQWHTVIWGNEQECLTIAKEFYSDCLYTWQ
jgi:hypothetical protein